MLGTVREPYSLQMHALSVLTKHTCSKSWGKDDGRKSRSDKKVLAKIVLIVVFVYTVYIFNLGQLSATMCVTFLQSDNVLDTGPIEISGAQRKQSIELLLSAPSSAFGS